MFERIFLAAVVLDMRRTGRHDSRFEDALARFQNLVRSQCGLGGGIQRDEVPSAAQVLAMCQRICEIGLVSATTARKSTSRCIAGDRFPVLGLNVQLDDIGFALRDCKLTGRLFS